MQPVVSYNNQTFRKIAYKAKWYVVYTKPCHEKKVYERVQQMNIEAYLPLQTTIRHWKDRKKIVSVPIFSCYLFVYITEKEYYKVLNIQGVVRYITFEGKAVPVPEKQIQLIKNIMELKTETAEVIDNLLTGNRVEIKAGPLIGITGELIEYNGKSRVIISIDEIHKSLLVNVPLNFLKLVG